MPVARRVGTVERVKAEQLLERLLQEWRAQQAGEGEPLIIEEAPRSGDRPNHLYVVWSEWDDLTPIERSRLIMQAYEKYRGRDVANSVTLAMGLTPDEARAMRIEF
jgi:hypothetical protein